MILSRPTASTRSHQDPASTASPTHGSGTTPRIVPPRGEADSPVSNPAHSPALRLSVERPAKGVVLIRMSGEIDLSSVDRLNELIRQRLTAAALRSVVLDLADVSFCGSYGVELLLHAQCRAEQRGIAMYVVPGTGAVDRLLRLTGLKDRFSLAETASEAVSEARH